MDNFIDLTLLRMFDFSGMHSIHRLRKGTCAIVKKTGTLSSMKNKQTNKKPLQNTFYIHNLFYTHCPNLGLLSDFY